MPRDTKITPIKKNQSKLPNKQKELERKKAENSDSDSDGDYLSDTESDEMDAIEYQKFLSKLFPSKYMNKKIKDLKNEKEQESEEEEEEQVSKSRRPIKEIKPKSKNNKRKSIIDDEEEWETASDEEEKEMVKNKHSKKSKNKGKTADSEDKENEKVNIIFTIGSCEDEDEYFYDDEDDEDYDDDESTEDEDEEVSTDEDTDNEDTEDDDETTDDDDDEDYVPPVKKASKNKKQTKPENKFTNKNKDKTLSKTLSKALNKPLSKIEKSENTENTITTVSNNTQQSSIEIINTSLLTEEETKSFELLREISKKNPTDKYIQECISVYENNLKKCDKKAKKKEQKQKDKNLRIFRKIIKDKNTMNDFSFYEKLEIDHQIKLIKELREINKITRVEKPYRMSLLDANMPVQLKSVAMKKINSLRYMEPGTGEYYKIKNWVDNFMRIPFNKYEELPVTIDDGVEKCHEFMENAQKTLEQAAYGLNDAKMQIMQMLGQLITNPKAIGTAIAVLGPPGTGKTTLIKEGVSKILNRPFAFIALGGATDSSFLEGHGYTYEGSTWGKIAQILIDSKCMNPVIYFDELDKISDTPKGEEITGILTHLTDTSQNTEFHDKYFSEVNFDLSKCLFIFSYNDESKVNPILKDRMYRIKTKGYNAKEKTIISNNYLLPKIREQVKFATEDIIIPEEVIQYIIDNYCNKEDGVRNLKRCMEIIHTKLNLYRLMKPDSNLFESDMSLKVSFPYTVTKLIVDKLIKREDEKNAAMYNMYV